MSASFAEYLSIFVENKYLDMKVSKSIKFSVHQMEIQSQSRAITKCRFPQARIEEGEPHCCTGLHLNTSCALVLAMQCLQ